MKKFGWKSLGDTVHKYNEILTSNSCSKILHVEFKDVISRNAYKDLSTILRNRYYFLTFLCIYVINIPSYKSSVAKFIQKKILHIAYFYQTNEKKREKEGE